MPNSKTAKFILPAMTKEALDELPFGVYIINKDGKIEFFNAAMAKISGVKEPKDIEGQNVLEIPNYKKYGLDEYVKKGLSGEPFKIEGIRYVSYVGKKESFRSYYGIPIKNEKNKVEKLFCIVEDVTKQKKNEERIKASLEEKKILLKELDHRIKNNMQIIFSLFNLRAQTIKDPDALNLIKESQAQIRSMLLIHESLYRSKDFVNIDFEDYIINLVNNLFDMHRIDRALITQSIKAKNVKLGIDQAIPCALIINELVSNSLRYAFPNKKKGKILIEIKPVDEINYKMIVSDDGVGFPGDLRNENSLGINLVSTLARQIYGSVEVNDNKGVEFVIKFPKNI